MKTRRMATVAVMAAALLASPYARAAVTNVVDVAALLAVANNNATTSTNGWTLHRIGAYSDPVLQFNSNDDWILSPDFGAPILRMEFSVRCTSTATRRLVIVNESTGGSGNEQEHEFTLCAASNTDEFQYFDFEPEERFAQFRLKINPKLGSNGSWGIGKLKIVFDFDAPTNLRVARKGGDWCRLSWENGANTASNRVDAYLVERGAGETALLDTGFDSFDATDKKNPVPSSDKLPGIDPLLSGINVYAPTNTSGICQVGKGDALGFLRYDGIGDYSNVVLRLRAKHYPGDNAETTVISVDSSGATNEVETIVLGDDYADYEIGLSSVTNAGSALLIGYYKKKSNRRVLIDSLSIVRTNADRRNLLETRWIPAIQGSASLSTKDCGIVLTPKSEYRFEVRAQNAYGLVSDPAAVDVVLDSPPGFRFILR